MSFRLNERHQYLPATVVVTGAAVVAELAVVTGPLVVVDCVVLDTV